MSLQRTLLVGVIALLVAVCGALAFAYNDVRSDVTDLRSEPVTEQRWVDEVVDAPIDEGELAELTARLDLLESRFDSSVETYPIEDDLVGRVSEIERQLESDIMGSPRPPDFRTLEQRVRKLELCISHLTDGLYGSEYDCR